MLSIVEVLRDFSPMLYGCDITIFTDHKISLFLILPRNASSFGELFLSKNMVQILWMLRDNIIADFFSRTPLSEGKEAPGLYGPAQTYDVDDLQYIDSDDFMLLPILSL